MPSRKHGFAASSEHARAAGLKGGAVVREKKRIGESVYGLSRSMNKRLKTLGKPLPKGFELNTAADLVEKKKKR